MVGGGPELMISRQETVADSEMSRSSPIDLGLVLDDLNDAQKTAATNPSSVLQILAPPGSGKTRTLTSRVAYLLSPPQCLNPQNVIVATFTVKAAREMKERISSLVGEGIENKLVLGTFHSIARRYLARYGHLVGLKYGWQIADSGDSLGICKRIIKRRNLPLEPSHVRSRISHFKARNTSPQANLLPPPSTHSTQSTQAKRKDIATEDFVLLYEDYCAALESSNLLDYDDLLIRCVELLQAYPKCVENVEAVLIDEFQDTNLVQFELMKLFAWKRQHITIVGDPDQSIYGFRAAEIRNLQRMLKTYPDTLVVHLEENYRSSGAILLAALEVIQQDTSRPKKALTPTHAVGTRPVLRRVPTAGVEAMWIVSEILRIRAMTAGMVNYGDVAILVRSASLTRVIETSLTRAGVRYRMVGGLRFFDRVEVKTVLDYLRVLQNTSNSDALVRIINVPPRKVGEATLKGLVDEADRKKKSLWELVFRSIRGEIRLDTKINKVAEKGLVEFVNVILTTKKLMDESDKNLAGIVQVLLKKLGYEQHLQRHYPEDWEARVANVKELLVQAQDVGVDEEALPEIEGMEQGGATTNSLYGGLEKFLANVALTNESKEEDEDNEKSKQGQVTISTIHAAKGLEWPIVFIPAVYEGSIPHSRAEDTDEERRLLYVAMTRAQALLYTSCSVRNSLKEKTTLSKFLTHPPLTPLLDKRGPKLGFSTVQSLALILGRQCPTEPELQAAIEKSGISSILDDQFPEKEAWEDDFDEESEDKECWEKMKSRRLEGKHPYPKESASRPQSWNIRGFQQYEGFTAVGAELPKSAVRYTTVDMLAAHSNMGMGLSVGMGTGMHVTGFKSAGAHMLELKKSRLNCEADRARKERMDHHQNIVAQSKSQNSLRTETKGSEPPPMLKAAPPRSTKRPAGQGSLLNYFQKSSDPRPSHPQEGAKGNTASIPSHLRKRSVPNASDVIKLSGNSKTLREQMDALPQPLLPPRPDPAASDTKKEEFILLSSSPVGPPQKRGRLAQNELHEPPSSPTFNAFVASVEEEIVMVDAADRNAHTTTSGIKNFRSSSAGPSASTVTTSRVGLRLESASAVNTPGSSSSDSVAQRPQTKRRTLGIRRSFNGWQNRARK